MNTSSNETYGIAHRIEEVQENSPDSTIEVQQNEAYMPPVFLLKEMRLMLL